MFFFLFIDKRFIDKRSRKKICNEQIKQPKVQNKMDRTNETNVDIQKSKSIDSIPHIQEDLLLHHLS